MTAYPESRSVVLYSMGMNPAASSLVAEGIDLIQTSRLARLEGRLVPEKREDFNQYWPTVHQKYGRWFCWHAFSVGAECILKATYVEKNIEQQDFGAGLNWRALGVPSADGRALGKRIMKLAKRRNEGAHGYLPNHRDAHFHEVEDEYVPALNMLLDIIGYPKS